MDAVTAILLFLEKTRLRSIMTWKAIPEQYLHWKPDDKAMSLIETIRHILDCDEWYKLMIIYEGNKKLDYDEIFGSRPFSSVENELAFNREHRQGFIDLISTLSEEQLDSIYIKRRNGKEPKLGEFLTDIGYHEAFHTGQIQSHLRTLGVDRPDIW